MKKISYVLLIIPVSILVLGVYISFRLGTIKDYAAINNAKSSTILYALEKNKIDVAKKILLTDLIQLIYEYDKSVYEKHFTIKATLCKDIPRYHMEEIKKYLSSGIYEFGKAKEYKKSILDNLKLIKIELCKDCKEDNK